MKELEERLNIEKQAWEENYMKKQVYVVFWPSTLYDTLNSSKQS